MNCPDINFPAKTACGLGECINKTQCLCPPSWSGKGDFVYGEPHCNNNIDALAAMWGFALFFSIVVCILCIHVTHCAASENISVNKKFYNSVQFYMCFFALISSINNVILSVLKSFDNNHHIGTDLLISIVFSIAASCLLNTIQYFLFVFIQVYDGLMKVFSLESRTQLKKIINALKKARTCFVIFTQFSAFIPMFMLLARSSEDMFYINVLYYICTAICNTFCSVAVLLIINPLKKDIDRTICISKELNVSVQNLNINYVHISHKLNITMKGTAFMGILNNLVLISMSGWAFLQAYSSYYIPVLSYTGATFCMFVVLISNKKNKNSCLKLFPRLLDKNELSFLNKTPHVSSTKINRANFLYKPKYTSSNSNNKL
jgi:hypothetical protein